MNSTEIGTMNRNAVTILTRGYTDNDKYLSLINRNKGISKHLDDKSTDILIFHEGNITESQQIFIKQQTPELKIIFVNVTEHAFKKEYEIHKWYEPTNLPIFPMGYRHMCHFWFIDFIKFCDNYDYIIRIDEDCFIDFNIDEVFSLLRDKLLVAGTIDRDDEYVTHGLNDFTLQFLRQHNFRDLKPKLPSGPYTNIFALNLLRVRSNVLLQKYMEAIDKSNNIYIYRWGDLPLWGESMHYIFSPNDVLITPKIKYFHGSLRKYVNGSSEQIKQMVDIVYKNEIESIKQKQKEHEIKKKAFKEKYKKIISNTAQLLIQKKVKNNRFKLL